MPQITEGQIRWVTNLSAVTSETAFPSSASTGVTPPSGYRGSRVHVRVLHTQASGTLSVIVALYGYATAGSQGSAARWVYLGSFNSGSAMTVNAATWSPDANTISVAEVFTVAPMNYERFTTRAISPGGSSPVTTTDIGFPVE